MSKLIQAPVHRHEIFAWALFDFANSGYTTVVLTAIFNAYFVGVIAQAYSSGTATLWWTIAMALANGVVLLTAPIIGAIADDRAWKKRFLMISASGCVGFTTLLATAGPGDVSYAMALVILASICFFTGENLIAAFLPEIATPDKMGRISAFGWTIGYLGGLLTLVLCLWVTLNAAAQGAEMADAVPLTLLIVAAMFVVGSLPTFIWLRERVQPCERAAINYCSIAYQRLHTTWQHARFHRDLFQFLIALTIYTCGINTVIVLAAVYAQEAMGFTTEDNIQLILIVNISAALGAFAFGQIQDRLGSLRTLSMTLVIWICALLLAYFTHDRMMFWVVANLVGIALGSSQSAGRAIIGLFSPPARAGEYFGLWGLATKLAAVIGPLCYGLITYVTQGDHRTALLVTTCFFMVGLLSLIGIDEKRGRGSAIQD